MRGGARSSPEREDAGNRAAHRHRSGRSAGGFHHLARYPAPGLQRQLTIDRPSFRVLSATPSGNGVVLPNKGLRARRKIAKTPLSVPAPRGGEGRTSRPRRRKRDVAGAHRERQLTSGLSGAGGVGAGREEGL